MMSSTVPEPAHRLAGDEVLARLHRVGEGVDAPLQRRRVHRARADGVAADALLHVVGGDRLGQADHRGLARAVDEAVGRPFTIEATEAMLMIEPLPFFSMPGMNARVTRNMDFTFRRSLVPVLGRAVEDRAVVHEAGAVEQHVDRRRLPRRPSRSPPRR